MSTAAINLMLPSTMAKVCPASTGHHNQEIMYNFKDPGPSKITLGNHRTHPQFETRLQTLCTYNQAEQQKLAIVAVRVYHAPTGNHAHKSQQRV